VWLLAAFGALILSLLLLFCVPLEAHFRVERVEALRGAVRVLWLFGRLSKEVEFPGPAGGRGARGDGAGRPGRARRRRSRGPVKASPGNVVRALARSPGFPARCGRLLARLWRLLGPRDGSVWVRAGLDEPADTGVLCGVVGPAIAWLRAGSAAPVDWEPDFDGPSLAFRARGVVRTIPLAVLAAFVSFVLCPATLRALGAVVRVTRR
jgi:hypothetical protein